MQNKTGRDSGAPFVVYGRLFLDRCADEGAPFCPGSVVVADVGVTQQVRQHKPGVGRALADAAVSDDVLVGRDALAAVELLEIRAGLKGSIFVDGLAPGDVLGTGDVAAALRPFLRQVFGGQWPAGGLLRVTDR